MKDVIHKSLVAAVMCSSLGLLWGIASPPVMAATIVVDTLEDVVAADGQCSLREAIMNANGANQSGSSDCTAGEVAGNRIHFDAALVGQTIVLNGTPLPIITRPLIMVGPADGDWSGLTIDGNDQVRVLQFDAGFTGSFVASVRGLTLSNGRTDALNQPGGAVWTRNVDLLFERVRIMDSRTTGPSSMAGGLWLSGGQVSLVDSQVIGNAAQNQGGGLMLTNVELELVRTTVAGNQASSGGGLRAVGSTLSIVDSEVSDNLSSSTSGGLALDSSVANIRNSTISGNSAATSAGAMYVNRSAVSLVHSTVAFNQAGNTPGVFVFGVDAEPASLALFNSLVVQGQTTQATCTASGQYATIEATNSLATHAGCTGEATPLASINPGPLADNGGPTRTHALLAGSVAIDAGGDCLLDYGLAQDQRGLPRPGGDSQACDLGALEAQELQAQADLALQMDVTPEQAASGQTVVFSLQVNNLGPDTANAVVVENQLPSGFALVSAVADLGSFDPATGLWSLAELASGQQGELILEVEVTATGPYLNMATVSAETFDPDLSNNQAEADVEIIELQADLAISKLVNPTQADVGANVVFTVIAANLGPDDATGVSVSEQLPAGYALVSAAVSQGSFDAGSGLWQLGQLANGGSATLTLQATVTAIDDYLNTATISGDQVDPNSGNNSASAGITLPPELADPIMVTTSLDVMADDGLCSLREAIINANEANQSGSADCGAGGSAGNRIVFHPDLAGATINIQGVALPNLTRPLLIEGPVTGQPEGLTLDGQQLARVLGATTGAHLQLRDLSITGGLASGSSSGGGISVINADLSLNRVRVHDNGTELGAGGGLNISGGQLSIVDSSIFDNTATSQGGGIRLNNGTGQILRSTIAGNVSGSSGGGVQAQASSLEIVNSTLSGNSANGQGGALQLGSSDLVMIHSSLVFNLASQQAQAIGLLGDVNNPASAALHSSLILQATPDQIACHAGAHASLAGAGNLVTDGSCPGITATLAAVAIGPLTANGGLTTTHALAPDSLAIGAAGLCGFEFGLLVDQRGQSRPGGASTLCDVGAYESQYRGDALFSDRFQGE